MTDQPAEEENKDILARFRENLKEEIPRFPFILGIVLIALFFISASLFPQISQKLGQLAVKKQGQQSYAQEEQSPKPQVTEFVSNEILIKVKKDARGKVREGKGPLETGIASLDKLNR